MEPRFTPDEYLDWYASQRNISREDIRVAENLVISWGPTVIELFAKRTNATLIEHWPRANRYPVYTAKLARTEISFAHVRVGAPGTIMALEDMITAGAKRIIGLGWAGSLQPAIPIGSLIIPTHCIRDEGTSRHYLPSEATVSPDPELLDQIASAAAEVGYPVFIGPHWTTDAPYREMIDTISQYRAQGIQGVDMETSAMYALGRVRSVAICNLLVISDEVWKKWSPAFGQSILKEHTMYAVDVLLHMFNNV